jgi:hypothetical protein
VVTVIEPVEATAWVGENVTDAFTLPPAGMVAPLAGAFVIANGAAGPVTELTVIGAFPMFEIVRVAGADVEPTVTLPNGTDEGDTDSWGALAGAPDVTTTFFTEWMSVLPPVAPLKPTSTFGGSVTAWLMYCVPSTETFMTPDAYVTLI